MTKRKTESKVGYLIKRSQQELRNRMDTKLGELGITVSQYAILSALTESSGLSNADLARKSFVKPQTMHRTLKTMEEKDLIVQQPNGRNLRVIEFIITEQGNQILRNANEMVDRIEEELYCGLTQEELETLGRLLEKLMGSLS